mgnify:CR=1 FL=1
MRHIVALSLSMAIGACGCANDSGPKDVTPPPAAREPASLAAYFAPEPAGVDTAGVRLVQIQTPRGPFKVWTKRIGRNHARRHLCLGRSGSHQHGQCAGQTPCLGHQGHSPHLDRRGAG